MSLQPSPLLPVPDDTVRVAHAAFPEGNPYLRAERERSHEIAEEPNHLVLDR